MEDKVDGKGWRGDGEVGKVAVWPTQSRNLARWGLGSCCSGGSVQHNITTQLYNIGWSGKAFLHELL